MGIFPGKNETDTEKESVVNRILPRYIRKRFIGIFLFCLVAVIMIFVVVDLVENLDRFIDKKVPGQIIFLYYLYSIPYTVVLVLPVATLLAAVFSIGGMARYNEVVAMKALGYSLYRVIATLMAMGLAVSLISFFLAEVVVVEANRRKEAIDVEYLQKSQLIKRIRARNVEIQEPPNSIVSIALFDGTQNLARDVEIKEFRDHRMVSRIDAPQMRYESGRWVVEKGVERVFEREEERLIEFSSTRYFDFHFTPKEILTAGIEPDAMNMGELLRFIDRIRRSGGTVYQWMTSLYLRFSYPLSNVIIVLFSVPLAYNRRKKNLAMGFGISLLICFLYFGIVKTGETMGQTGSLSPLLAAWLGNIILTVAGVLNLVKTRK